MNKELWKRPHQLVETSRKCGGVRGLAGFSQAAIEVLKGYISGQGKGRIPLGSVASKPQSV